MFEQPASGRARPLHPNMGIFEHAAITQSTQMFPQSTRASHQFEYERNIHKITIRQRDKGELMTSIEFWSMVEMLRGGALVILGGTKHGTRRWRAMDDERRKQAILQGTRARRARSEINRLAERHGSAARREISDRWQAEEKRTHFFASTRSCNS